MVENNLQLAVRFLRANLHGWQWAVENPTEAVDIMLGLFPEMADDRDFHIASFEAYIPLVQPLGVQIGSIDCERWLLDERFETLDTTDDLCTTAIFEAAVADD